MQKSHFVAIFKYAMLAAIAFSLAGCLGKYYPKDFRTDKTQQTNATGTMKPYTVNGKTYYPTVVGVGETATGIASWYGPGFHGKKTSNGETYNQNAFTAAHKTLPMNTILSVTNLDNGRKTTVRINDRGPFAENRIIDLSKAAATRLDMITSGTAPVKLEVIGFDSSDGTSTPAPISNDISTSTSTDQNLSTLGVSDIGVSDIIDVPASTATQVTDTDYTGGGFMVQIGAYKFEEGAKSTAERYNGYKGYKTYSRKSSRDGLTRVFLRGFKSEDEAKDFVKSGEFSGAFVVRE